MALLTGKTGEGHVEIDSHGGLGTGGIVHDDVCSAKGQKTELE